MKIFAIVSLIYSTSTWTEDDPYHFLYYGPLPRPPSYFALERDQPESGWVIRFDSLSKVLSSGIRLGFVSGPEILVQAMNDHVSVRPLLMDIEANSYLCVLYTDYSLHPAAQFLGTDSCTLSVIALGTSRVLRPYQAGL